MMTVYIHIVVYGVYLSSDLLLTFKNDIDYCSYYVCTYMIDYIVTCHICMYVLVLGVTRDYLFLLPTTSLHSLVLTPTPLTTLPVTRRISDEINWESENLPQVPQRRQCIGSA